jgi:hypothetical protein
MVLNAATNVLLSVVVDLAARDIATTTIYAPRPFQSGTAADNAARVRTGAVWRCSACFRCWFSAEGTRFYVSSPANTCAAIWRMVACALLMAVVCAGDSLLILVGRLRKNAALPSPSGGAAFSSFSALQHKEHSPCYSRCLSNCWLSKRAAGVGPPFYGRRGDFAATRELVGAHVVACC